MRLLETVKVGSSRVELLHGDLTDIPPEFRVDLLVVSAFPNNYAPVPGTLIAALERKGLSVGALAADKDEDLRESFSCWLSKEFRPPDPGLGFRRVLCFEPASRGNPPETVSDIYQALVPVLGRDSTIRSIAMPIVAAGNQAYPVEEILAPLLEASVHWLGSGLPLDVVRITAFSDGDAGKARHLWNTDYTIFRAIRAQDEQTEADTPVRAAASAPRPSSRPPVQAAPARVGWLARLKHLWRRAPAADPPPSPAPQTVTEEAGRMLDAWMQGMDYDVFISYAHTNSAEMEAFETELTRLAPDIRIYLDRKKLDVGAAWQAEIFESLDRCRKVVALFSPAYLESKVCKEEFNIAWVRARESDQEVLFPVYVYSARLPTYMKLKLYADCREGDPARYREAARKLVESLGMHLSH